MLRPISFLPSSTSAGASSVILVILFSLYVIPFGTIVCGGISLSPADIQAGSSFFEKPGTIPVSIKADGTFFIGPSIVPAGQLVSVLRDVRRTLPNLALEIRGDRRASSTDVFRALAAARDAGYSEAYVFGNEHSILELSAAISRRKGAG